jgi:hypothetical protein
LIAADDRFADALVGKMTPKLHNLLAARRRNLVDIMNTENVMISLKQKRFWTAFRLLMRRPEICPRVMRQLREAIGNRFERTP